MAREWRSKRVVERDRNESRRLVLITSGSVVLLSVVLLFVLPAGWRHPSSSTPAPSSLPSAAPRVPRIAITHGAITLDGAVVAHTETLEASGRVQRIDDLFDAMKRRRENDGPPAEDAGSRSVEIVVGADVPAFVVKSAVQTLAFAGYPDVRFAVLDAGVSP
ncbi:MAG TPA: hypothetical protein VF407_10310 [Polyangiaceae bacterium]